MNREEAAAILNARLEDYRRLAYAELAAKIGNEEITEAVGPTGTTWQIEVLVLWDAKPNGDLRVLGSIDDGSFRGAFRPVCLDFLVAPPR